MPKALKILKELNPKKLSLFEYSEFKIIVTKKNSVFPIHDDTPNKLLSGVIYLHPKKNIGTIFYNKRKQIKPEKIVSWKKNRAVFFSRIERVTWHSYQGNKKEDRIALIYNLMTSENKIKDVFKVENTGYFFGKLRYKLNPYIFKFLKITI